MVEQYLRNDDPFTRRVARAVLARMEGPAELYEKFLGFTPEEEANLCKKAGEIWKSALAGNITLATCSEARVLSIGTGYGRVDMPMIKALIQYWEGQSDGPRSFHIVCVDPTEHFWKKLADYLSEDDKHYRIFADRPKREDSNLYKNYQVFHGASATRESTVTIELCPVGLDDFLKERKAERFQYILGILSLLMLPNIQTTVPSTLEQLDPDGIFVAGQVSANGMNLWLSAPPPPIPPAYIRHNSEYLRWYGMWQEWHNALRLFDYNRRLRVFMPHYSKPLSDALENVGYLCPINGCKQRHDDCERLQFQAERRVDGETIHQILEQIRIGGLHRTISSLSITELADIRVGDAQLISTKSGKAHPATEVLLQPQPFVKHLVRHLVPALKQSEPDGPEAQESNTKWWSEAMEKGVSFQNGIRFLVFRKPNSCETIKKGKELKVALQQAILDRAAETVHEQRLHRPDASKKEEGQDELNRQLVESMIHAISHDRDAAVAAISVIKGQPHACISGPLIPVSHEAMMTNGISKLSREFFYPLLGEQITNPCVVWPRVWLWLLTLNLTGSKRVTDIASVLKKTFGIKGDLNVVVNYAAERESIDFHEDEISISLRVDRAQILRAEAWKWIKEYCGASGILTAIMDWDRDHKAVQELEAAWESQPAIIRSMAESGAEKILLPPSFIFPETAATADRDRLKAIFGESLLANWRGKMQELYGNWGKADAVSGEQSICSVLTDLYERGEIDIDRKDYDPQDTDPLPLQLWKTQIAKLYNQNLIYNLTGTEAEPGESNAGSSMIFHVPSSTADKQSVWGGFLLFVSNRTRSLLTKDSREDAPSPLNERFYQFVTPYDFVYFQNVVNPQMAKAIGDERIAAYARGAAHGFKNALLLPPMILAGQQKRFARYASLGKGLVVDDALVRSIATVEDDLQCANSMMLLLQLQAQMFFWVMSPERFREEKDDIRQQYRWPEMNIGQVVGMSAMLGFAVLYTTSPPENIQLLQTNDAMNSDEKSKLVKGMARIAAGQADRYRDMDVKLISAKDLQQAISAAGIGCIAVNLVFESSYDELLPVDGVLRGALEAVFIELIQNGARSALHGVAPAPHLTITIRQDQTTIFVTLVNSSPARTAWRLWQFRRAQEQGHNPSGGIRGLRQIRAMEESIASELRAKSEKPPFTIHWPKEPEQYKHISSEEDIPKDAWEDITWVIEIRAKKSQRTAM